MKKISLLLVFLLKLTSLNAQWVIQYNQGGANLTSIQFFNENTGNVFGWNSGLNWGGYFFKTTTGGMNWDSMPLPSFMSTIHLFKQSFINEQTGYVCGFTNKIFKTTDGGLNWYYSIAPSNNTYNPAYNAIHFLNEQTGYIGGRYGQRAKTTNGGNNWITLDSAFDDIVSMDFVDADFGFMGDSWSDIYKTTNGGQTWSYKYLKDSLSNEYSYNGIKFINYNTGYLIGTSLNGGVLFKTTNGGVNWIDILINQNNSFSSLFIVEGSIIYIGCSNQRLILKSSNGGASWTNQYLPIESPYIVTYFINPNIGYATTVGHIYKTTNGGVYVNTIYSDIPRDFILFQNYPNPFNPSTKIKYTIPSIVNSQSSMVKLVVFDILGEESATLVNQKQKPGSYEVQFDGKDFPSGVYYYVLYADEVRMDAKKMVLLK